MECYLSSQKSFCKKYKGLVSCNGDIETTYLISGHQLIIELINEHFSSESDIAKDIIIKPSDIPDKLQLSGKDFYLRGVVEAFHTKSEKINEIGHYVAVCKRLNKHWELFDDTGKKSKHFPNYKKILVSA